jgi:actin-related protein
LDVFDVKIETNKKFIHEKFIMKLKNIVLSILLSSSVTISSTVYAEDVPFSQELVEQAKSGNAEAQNNLGDAYYYGNDVDQDFGKALEWFKSQLRKEMQMHFFSRLHV